jgi:hypothetical protein
MASGRERLDLEEQIAEAIKNQVASVESFGQAQKKVRDNLKTIRRLNAEIAEATDEEREALERQRDLLIGINEELRKGKNYLKAAGNEALNYGKQLKQSLWNASSIWDKMLEIESSTKRTAAQVGFYGNRYKTLNTQISIGRQSMIDMGFAAEDAVKAQANFAEETGRQVILGKEAYDAMSETARATGMAVEEVSSLAGQMEAFGLGAVQATDYIYNISEISEKMGVNSNKVTKKFQSNLNMLNKLDFKGGMKGMAKMAAHSERFKLSMEAVASVSDKVFRPEGAVEAAANLQVLGGSLAQLGDPFQLMYKARYAPEELAKSITKAATASAVFNEKTGEFEVNALELDRMREAANALGMDYTELVQTAKQSAKINMFEKSLGQIKKEDRALISGMAEMVNGEGQISFVNKDGELIDKSINQLTQTEVDYIKKNEKDRKERARHMMALTDRWQQLQGQLMEVGLKFLQPIVDAFSEFGENKSWMENSFDSLIEGVKWFANIVGKVSKFLGPTGVLAVLLADKLGLFKLAGWYLRGLTLGKGFDMSMKKSSFMNKLTGGAGGGGGGGTPPTPPPGPQGPQQMTKGFDYKNLIKGAAAILILSAALFVFAKALQEFDKLENGWETLGIAAGSMIILAGGLFIVGKIVEKGAKNLFLGALAMAAMGVAFIPFAYGLSLLQGLNWETLGMAGVALLGLTAALFGLGALMSAGGGIGALIFLAGAAAMVVMGAALMVFGLGLQAVVNPIERFNTSMLSMSNIDFSKVVGGIKSIGVAIEGLNTENLVDFNATVEALNSLKNDPIRIEFGEISGKIDIGGDGQSVDLSPSQLSELL